MTGPISPVMPPSANDYRYLLAVRWLDCSRGQLIDEQPPSSGMRYVMEWKLILNKSSVAKQFTHDDLVLAVGGF